MRVNALASVIVAAGLAAVSTVTFAQNAASPAPARETPRPEDLEPRVNTSAPSVDTHEAAPDATTGTAADAVAPAIASPSTNALPSGTPASRGPGATGPATTTGTTGTTGATDAPGAPGAPSTQPNADAQGASATAKPAPKGRALDRIELDTTQITGNRELPKVLYIVPWKRSDLGDLVGKPINSLLDEVLTPVDRDVFQRENRYYRALTPGAVENDALSAPDSRPPKPTRNPVPTNSAPAAGMPGSATYPANAPAAGGSSASGSAAPPGRDEK